VFEVGPHGLDSYVTEDTTDHVRCMYGTWTTFHFQQRTGTGSLRFSQMHRDSSVTLYIQRNTRVIISCATVYLCQ